MSDKARDQECRAILATAIKSRGAKRSSATVTAFRCPRHEDGQASAWLGEYQWGCFACGFTEQFDSLAETLGVELPPRIRHRDPNGFTLDDYAKYKGFSPVQLAAWGVQDGSLRGHPAIKTPYRKADGTIIGYKLRTLINGKRDMLWDGPKGSFPYGLDIFAASDPKKGVLFVEGESDTQTCWLYGVTALGISGNRAWKPEYAELVQGRTVYIWEEPGPSGEAFSRAILADLPNAIVLRNTGVKDLSDLHLREGVAFRDSLAGFIKAAKETHLSQSRASDYAQHQAAKAALARPASDYKRLPWPSLDRIVGPIPPASLWYVAFLSGNGKTTLLGSFVDLAIARGQRVYVMPLEVKPEQFRRILAARRCGFLPGYVVSGEFTESHLADQQVAALSAELDAILELPIKISDAQNCSPSAILTAAREAQEFGADWFIVDHIDHLPGKGGIEESVTANTTLFQATQQYQLRTFAATQMNQHASRSDDLAYHVLPREDWIKYGKYKQEKADGILGGYRQLRLDATKEELKDYRARKIPMEQICEPNTMTVGLLKHRAYGNRLGQRAVLSVRNGHVEEMPAIDREQMEHGIATTRRTF
jgi:hypothetical protein